MATSANRNLHQAKKAKKDEFYTQLVDIENELKLTKGKPTTSSRGAKAARRRWRIVRCFAVSVTAQKAITKKLKKPRSTQHDF